MSFKLEQTLSPGMIHRDAFTAYATYHLTMRIYPCLNTYMTVSNLKPFTESLEDCFQTLGRLGCMKGDLVDVSALQSLAYAHMERNGIYRTSLPGIGDVDFTLSDVDCFLSGLVQMRPTA